MSLGLLRVRPSKHFACTTGIKRGAIVVLASFAALLLGPVLSAHADTPSLTMQDRSSGPATPLSTDSHSPSTVPCATPLTFHGSGFVTPSTYYLDVVPTSLSGYFVVNNLIGPVGSDSSFSASLSETQNTVGPTDISAGSGYAVTLGIYTDRFTYYNFYFKCATTSGAGGGSTGTGTDTPELGSAELLTTGLLPIGLAVLYRRRRKATPRRKPLASVVIEESRHRHP